MKLVHWDGPGNKSGQASGARVSRTNNSISAGIGAAELHLLNTLSKWFMDYIRPHADELVRRLAEPRRFIRKIAGI